MYPSGAPEAMMSTCGIAPPSIAYTAAAFWFAPRKVPSASVQNAAAGPYPPSWELATRLVNDPSGATDWTLDCETLPRRLGLCYRPSLAH